MFQKVNLLWKIAVNSVGCVLVIFLFVADTKIIFGYNFSSFKIGKMVADTVNLIMVIRLNNVNGKLA